MARWEVSGCGSAQLSVLSLHQLKLKAMNKFILLTAICFIFGISLNAQHTENIDPQNDVELLIVKNADGCTDAESYIYEMKNKNLKKLAYLYPETAHANTQNNAYNSQMIQKVLTEYALDGYDITETRVENYSSACDKKMVYRLTPSMETFAAAKEVK
ncbi:MAG: hypothetical protein WEC59_06690 [Salibacteraceae bacterium]